MNHTKPLQALIVKKNSNKLQIIGPKTAKEVAGWDDVDLVILLCDHTEMSKPEHALELKTFKECTFKSKISEESNRSIKHIRTISYMLGTVLMEELKDFYFDGVEYRGING